jgi:hypothetical protein
MAEALAHLLPEPHLRSVKDAKNRYRSIDPAVDTMRNNVGQAGHHPFACPGRVVFTADLEWTANA